ncbi:MAG TPA: type II secretion system protein [Anaeromyxobacter sp.]
MTGARRRERGFTLIELVVVVGVIALLALAAAPALGTLTGANARESAGRLAGGMRFLFDTAALRHATCRMALDPAARAWWAECAPGGAAMLSANARSDEEDLARRFPDDKDDQIRQLLAKTTFGAFSDRLVERRELPGRAAFGKLRVEGAADSEGGVTYVYFFPGGQAQRAFVPIVDGSNVFTVVVEPFTGRAKVVPGAVEGRD